MCRVHIHPCQSKLHARRRLQTAEESVPILARVGEAIIDYGTGAEILAAARRIVGVAD